MIRADSGIVRALVAGLAVGWMALAPRPACGQSSWPSYPNNTTISVTSGGNVGVGTSNPGAKLDVIGARNNTSSLRASDGANSLGFGFNSAGWPILTGNITARVTIPGFEIWGSGGTHYMDVRDASGSQVIKLNGTGHSFFNQAGNVGIGTTNPQYKLAVNGVIGAKDIIVTNTGWSDYVFKPGYRLRPLSEVGAYIRTHRHLPDIPTEAEVKEKGVSVGEMQAKLLAKIEELTLHMIQQDREIRELRDRLAQSGTQPVR